MATHSNVLAWRIPGTGEPGGLPSMGSHRVGHDWSDLAAAAAAILMCSTHTQIKQQTPIRTQQVEQRSRQSQLSEELTKRSSLFSLTQNSSQKSRHCSKRLQGSGASGKCLVKKTLTCTHKKWLKQQISCYKCFTTIFKLKKGGGQVGLNNFMETLEEKTQESGASSRKEWHEEHCGREAKGWLQVLGPNTRSC